MSTSTQRVLLTWAEAYLGPSEASDPSRDARTLLEWVLGVDSLWHAPREVSAEAEERFRDAIEARARHVPLQHITGRMWFRGLELLARPGVFIVRPETEVVAGRAIEAAQAVSAGGRAPLVVDLCTGSGAIALSIAHEVPDARILAVEIDPVAVALTRTNTERLAPGRVRIVEDDARVAFGDLEGGVDVVATNPPYIPDSEIPTQPEALADPPLALYGGGEDGLGIPGALVPRAEILLREGGILVMEHAESQADVLRKLARRCGFLDVHTETDLAGRGRMLVARRGPRRAHRGSEAV